MSRAASSAGSRGTKGSRMSRSSYRRVAPTSQVDEALFGNTDTPSAAKRAGASARGGRRGGPAAADVVSMESIEKLLGNRPQANAPDSTVIGIWRLFSLAHPSSAQPCPLPEERR